MTRHEFVLPELGADTAVVSLWLVEVGQEISAGDRLLEVLCHSASVDLPSPVNGILVEQRVAEDDPLSTGQVLGVIDDLDEPNGNVN